MTTEKQKQPRSLYMLFFAEMWERFSFYGMRALLVLYLTRQLFADLGEAGAEAKAYGIYAAYGSLVYATPFLGGIIADKLLGYKKSVLLGGVLMAIGHFIMAIETEFFLYVALAFLIAGNGFFKPNISSMVGGLYDDRNDPRRDGGFTIFYMGINLGAGVAPLVCGYLGETVGWWLGFGLAGLGMLAGLAVFGWGQGMLGENGNPPSDLLKEKIGPVNWEIATYVLAVISCVVFALLVQHYELMTYVLTPFAIGVFAVIFVTAVRSEKVERERLFVVLVLLFFSTLFWAFFEQAGSSMTVFTNLNVDRGSIRASLFQSVNPTFILILAPLFSLLWVKLGVRGKEPSTPVKFALGILQLGLGFVLLGYSAGFVMDGTVEVTEATADGGTAIVTQVAAVVPLFFLVGAYFLHTTGELCLSPIGLSMVTKLSPQRIMAMVMGAWFLSSAMAHHVGGIIALLTKAPETGEAPGQLAVDMGVLSSLDGKSAELLESYDRIANSTDVFAQLGWVAVGAAALCLVLSPLLAKWMHLDVADSPAPKRTEEEPSTF